MEPGPTSCICITSQELPFQETQSFPLKVQRLSSLLLSGEELHHTDCTHTAPYPILVLHPASYCLPPIVWVECEESSLFTHVSIRQQTAVWTLASLTWVSLRLCSLPPDQLRTSQENPNKPFSAHTSAEFCCLPAYKVTGSFWPILNMKTIFCFFFIEVQSIYHAVLVSGVQHSHSVYVCVYI